MTGTLTSLAAFAPVDQHYSLQARQMQALSFSVHIPLVCFEISLPVMVLFAEWLYLRSGDPVYRTVAQRWSRVMLTLFAVGVITGTALSFETGLLWPNFTGTFGSVFGLGFAIEGLSFFIEAISSVSTHDRRQCCNGQRDRQRHPLVASPPPPADARTHTRRRGRSRRRHTQGPVRDWAARDVAKSQLTKLAALEGLPRTTPGSPPAGECGAGLVSGDGWDRHVLGLIGVVYLVAWIRRKRLPSVSRTRCATVTGGGVGPMLLKALPLTFVLVELALYTALAGADFGAGLCSCSRDAANAPNGSARTPTARWGRCGTPTTTPFARCFRRR